MRVLDLTHALSAEIPTWDGTPAFSAENSASIAGDGYLNRQLHFDEHAGTHIDAPAHMIVSGKTVDRLEVQTLLLPLSVVDFRQESSLSPDATLKVSHLENWEATHGLIPQQCALLLKTGWGEFWGDPRRYRNPDSSGELHFPGFSLEAARWLIEQRQVRALGIDTLSIDAASALSLPVHSFALQREVYLLENVHFTEELPPTGATLVVAPLKIASGSGAPVRLLALLDA